jgi:hypothetical protein
VAAAARHAVAGVNGASVIVVAAAVRAGALAGNADVDRAAVTVNLAINGRIDTDALVASVDGAVVVVIAVDGGKRALASGKCALVVGASIVVVASLGSEDALAGGAGVIGALVAVVADHGSVLAFARSRAGIDGAGVPIVAVLDVVLADTIAGIAGIKCAGVPVVAVLRGVRADAISARVAGAEEAVIAVHRGVDAALDRVAGVDRARVEVVADDVGGLAANSGDTRLGSTGVVVIRARDREELADTGAGVARVGGADLAVVANLGSVGARAIGRVALIDGARVAIIASD